MPAYIANRNQRVRLGQDLQIPGTTRFHSRLVPFKEKDTFSLVYLLMRRPDQSRLSELTAIGRIGAASSYLLLARSQYLPEEGRNKRVNERQIE